MKPNPDEHSSSPVAARPTPCLILAQRPGVKWLRAALADDWTIHLAAASEAVSTAADVPNGAPPALLVRWGATDGPDGARLTLNRRERLLAVQDPLEVRQIWAAARVRTLPPEVSPAQVRRRLRVDLCNGQVLAVHLRRRGGKLQPLAWRESREGTLAAWHAMRAMHALRLDFGAVWIGIHGFRTYALAVDPAPPLNRATASRYATALQELTQADTWWPGDPPAVVTGLVMGADPEFALRDHATGRMLAASDFFPRFGVVGCDRQVMDRATHSLALVEVRPAPSASPAELVQHIRQALLLAARRMPGRRVDWLAGSRPFPRFAIGGHIHFSGIPLSGPLLVALDNYLALPVMMLERRSTGRLRRQRYGFLGDIRLKDHGGFEYRTLPSWLVSPALARGVLTLARLVATHYTFLRHDWLADPALQATFHDCSKDDFYGLMAELWQELEALPNYGEYEEDLTILKAMIERRQRWNEQVNIRETWRV